jgi:heme-degrading monooxygenase HmoA
MKRRGTVVVMYDAPASADTWMHGPHYEEVKATPGVIAVRRYEGLEGPPGARRYVALIESEDIEATVAWRSSPEGKRSQEEANSRGVTNRYAMVCRPVYSSVPGETQ